MTYLRLPLVFAFVLPGCEGCSDSGIRHINALPSASIVSPLDEASVYEDAPVVLRGEVGDYEDDPTELDVHWMVGSQRVCPDSSAADEDGVTTCETTLTDSDLVTLRVFDSDSESTEDFRLYNEVRPVGSSQPIQMEKKGRRTEITELNFYIYLGLDPQSTGSITRLWPDDKTRCEEG